MVAAIAGRTPPLESATLHAQRRSPLRTALGGSVVHRLEKSMREQILYRAHPPMFRNNPFGFVISVLLIGAAVGIVILLVWYVRTRSERLTVTSEELRYERGILSRTHNEVRLSAIRSIRVKQSLCQRLFGTGDIDVFTAGDLPEVAVRGIPDPHEVRELVAEHS